MLRIKSKLAIALLLSLLLEGVTFGQLRTAEIAAKYSPSVVTIVALDQNNQPLALGSGFFINKSGDIATNHHILQGSAKAIIKTTREEKGEITEIVRDDPKLDLLVAKTSLTGKPALPLGDSDAVTVGEDIVAIGNPAGLEGTVSRGIISGIREAEGMRFIQITAPISPGSSGGPVFNLSGMVIGVATAYVTGGQNLNFAMPVNYLKDLEPVSLRLSALGKRTTEVAGLKEGGTLVDVVGLHKNIGSMYPNLTSVDFSIRNGCDHPIRNVSLFFVYRDHEGQIIDYSAESFAEPVLPRLAKRFNHGHFIRNFRQRIGGKNYEGEVEVRVLDYQIHRSDTTSPLDLILK
jgi:hypothetical protein